MEQETLLDLQELYSKGLLIPVIGSGLSMPFGLPDWKKLILDAAEFFHLSSENQDKIEKQLAAYDFLTPVDVITEHGVSEIELQKYVAESMKAAKKKIAVTEVENNYTDFAKVSNLRFMTTNYDEYLNEISGKKTFYLSELSGIAVNQFPLRHYNNVVIPLHGQISEPESIVLSRGSYEKLYDSEEFEQEFQHLRTHFTFLFMGFSFDDKYFAKMFERMLKRFQARHYILFEEHVDGAKIERLGKEYGVQAILYKAGKCTHQQAIHQILQEIFCLYDSELDTSALKKLPEAEEEKLSGEEEKVVSQGRKLIESQNYTELQELYLPIYEKSDFEEKTPGFQIEILCGLAWYYGFLREDEYVKDMISKALLRPEIAAGKKKLVFMYGQVLWNLRAFGECKRVLESFVEEKKGLLRLFYEIVCCYAELLPDCEEQKGVIPVYGERERTEEETFRFANVYGKLKQSYINPDTYNLRNLAEYEDLDSQHVAYYWLGTAAGQLFHEHGDAVEYLMRAYELKPTLAACEELARNYLAIAEEKIRYAKNPKVHQVDMNALLKARIRFQYVMNTSDETARHSIYRQSGLDYLRTLYLLRDYRSFEEEYQKIHNDIPDEQSYLLQMLKAENDACYEHTVADEVLNGLKEEDKEYVRYVCAVNRASLMANINQNESQRIYHEIILHFKKNNSEQCIQDKRILQIVLDSVFFAGDVSFYEEMKKQYEPAFFSDMQELGFEDELYGKLEVAQSRYEDAFWKYKDIATFHILKGFYLRHGKRKECTQLYKDVFAAPPDAMFQTTQFYMEYVLEDIISWKNPWNSMRKYQACRAKFQDDVMRRKELEEMLKIDCADYENYEERVEWNRYMLEKSPRYAQIGLYRSILYLYIANLKYQKAMDVIEEMKEKNIFIPDRCDDLVKVCMEKQPRRCYFRQKPSFSSEKEALDQIERSKMAQGYNRIFFHDFGLENPERESVVVFISSLFVLFRYNRQRELEKVHTVYVTYAGIISLQASLWAGEDSFFRMVLQWLKSAPNVKLCAPEFEYFCKAMPTDMGRRYSSEKLQLKLFCEEHPEVVVL